MLYMIAGLPFSGQMILAKAAVKRGVNLVHYETEDEYYEGIPGEYRNRVENIDGVKEYMVNCRRKNGLFILRSIEEWEELYFKGGALLIYIRVPLKKRLSMMKESKNELKKAIYYYMPSGHKKFINGQMEKVEDEGEDNNMQKFIKKISKNETDAEVLAVIDSLYTYCDFNGDHKQGLTIAETIKIHKRRRNERENTIYSDLEREADFKYNDIKTKDIENIIKLISRGEVDTFKRMATDQYFMSLSEVVSTRANCIKRKMGAVFVKDNRIVSVGYNGTASNTIDCFDGGCYRCYHLAVSRAKLLEHCFCLHAEQNALLDVGNTLSDYNNTTIYCTTFPCISCTKMIIQSNIKRVVYLNSYLDDEPNANYMRENGILVERINECANDV